MPVLSWPFTAARYYVDTEPGNEYRGSVQRATSYRRHRPFQSNSSHPTTHAVQVHEGTRTHRAARQTSLRPDQKRVLRQPEQHGPQSQSFYRRYGSNLPTSLTYIVQKARGCSPWRPDADMGTACHENYIASPGFSRADERVPDTTKRMVLYRGDDPISGQSDSRVGALLTKKRELFPELSPTSPGSVALPR